MHARVGYSWPTVRWGLALPLLVLVATGGAACTTLFGDLPDGTLAEVGVSDGGSDGGSDSGTRFHHWGEGGALDAAGDDAGPPPGDAGVKTFCQALPKVVTFCRDFDDGHHYYDDFTVWTGDSCSVSADSAESESNPPTNSLVVDTPASSKNPFAGMERQFNGIQPNPNDISVSFDVRVGAAGPDMTSVIGFGTQFGNANDHDLYLYVSTNRSAVEEYVGADPSGQHYYDYYFTNGQVPVGSWAHVDIHLVNSRLTTLLNGVTVIDNVAVHTWTPDVVTFDIGITTTKPGTVWHMRFDNIVVDLH